MIDSRFPKQPTKLEVPLYPLQAELNLFLPGLRGSEKTLQNRIASFFNMNADACFLFSMGRIALRQLLVFLNTNKEGPLKVAIPSFYCPHTAREILSAGVRAIFFDISTCFDIDEVAIDSVLYAKCDVMIWPDLFVGSSPKNIRLVEKLKGQGILVIRDLAHTFPFKTFYPQPEVCWDVTLFSFGHSKPLAGVGGGGLVIHSESLKKNYAAYLKEKDSDSQVPSYLAYIRASFYALLRRYIPRLSMRLGLIPDLWCDQRQLLEFILKDIPKKEHTSITPWQAAIALQHWDRMFKVFDLHKMTLQEVVEMVRRCLGLYAVEHLISAAHVGICAIRTPPHMRFQISELLADKGIQTTWYYYPLSKLEFFSRVERQAVPNTERLADDILILPCQWIHTEKGYNKKLLKALELIDAC